MDLHQTGWLHITESLRVALYKKLPGKFHRLMTKLLLGWRYEEL